MRPAPRHASRWCAWLGCGRCPSTSPNNEELGVGVLKGPVVEAVDDHLVSEGLNCAFKRPELHGQLLNDHPDVQHPLLVHGVGVLPPWLQQERHAVDG